ncbi:phosphatidylethanolamine binding protein [Heterobasidion irregulare TC 32-1]|uniref:Phosphatidylethanolamine binding protein n=1 Tax=Heterobasidion irregulare (strain TC 32-1) TaxID=747525 RepID=W4K9F7_HETIT|nr:phosphatidylethanolamine binding protein [Heterobasidion irregulare TC 32-1]ETW81985.1 phosphatidylethanolamine binding protein [Heterobasidion irregulare TC 32-1]
MKPIFVLSVVIVQVFATSRGDTSLSAVKGAFDAANIPSNASLTFNPSVLLEVTFPETNSPVIHLHAGIQLPRNKTAGPPTFGIHPHGSLEIPTGRFVVAMVDLDAPTPQNPTSAQIRHFLGGDFSLGPVGLDGIAPLTNSTPALSHFLQPTPPAGSDPHRYVFLLFHQPATFDQQNFLNSSTPISLFNISLFADEVGLGHPLGGTFMRVGPDPSASDV